MSINFTDRLQTYVAQNERGEVLGIYDPSKYGTVADFKREMVTPMRDRLSLGVTGRSA